MGPLVQALDVGGSPRRYVDEVLCSRWSVAKSLPGIEVAVLSLTLVTDLSSLIASVRGFDVES